MLEIKKQYIINENNKKVGVQLDIETFKKIEQLLEDYALGQLIKENDTNEVLDLDEAREYYSKLKKVK
ncbi:MAG: hypothetical protein H7263_18130 [Candidatus Sericytochromatia bacterium]|nr:hypothetical protein [Candidatus Sericytochromatia bacterium]